MFNGVSQQPPALRLPSQANIQENGQSSVVDGLSKRPPTRHIAKFNTKSNSEIYIHTINRDKFSQYVVMIENGELYVYDLDGNNIPVDYPDGKSYLSTSTPRDDFSAVTVADYTFIVNKKTTVRQTSQTAAGTLSGSVQQFIDLPDSGGGYYEIAGTGANNFDNYYVKKVGDVWRETVKPGLKTHFDKNTMPHALIDEGNGRFTFKELDWDPRYVGDDLTAKFPSFTNNKISDVFFHRNRLGFLSSENVIFSRSGDFFNFFPETVTTILDTDPVDVAVSHNKVATLKHATSYNTSLMLFADQAQFQLTAKDVLTPKTAAINVTTEYNVNTKVTPVSAGTSLYFAVNKGESTNIKEYEVQPLTYNNEAADVTAHCPRYIPNDCYKLASSDLEQTVIALCESGKNEMYVYKYYWATPDEKVQSSWSKFLFDSQDTILNADFIDNKLYIVVQRYDGTYLEMMDFSYNQVEEDLGFLIHLDHREDIKGVFDPETLHTTWTVPYPTTGAGWQGVLGVDFEGQVGGTLNLKSNGEYTLETIGDWSAHPVTIGKQYRFKYQLSPIYYKDSQKLAVPHYKLNLKNMHLFYDRSGYFKVTVDMKGSDTYEYTLNPTLGDELLTIGKATISRGNFRFPIFGDGEQTKITIESDSMFPVSIQGAEYEALVTNHSSHQ
jgi:hypothetical protein